MKICEKTTVDEETENLPPKSGHLYRIKSGTFKGQVHICSNENDLVFIEDGCIYSKQGGFGHNPGNWEEVTDQYCLQKVLQKVE